MGRDSDPNEQGPSVVFHSNRRSPFAVRNPQETKFGFRKRAAPKVLDKTRRSSPRRGTHAKLGLDGNWTGMLSDQDAAGLDLSRVEYLPGPAGSITIHNARTLHFSPSSKSPTPRPLLLNCFTSADAKPYTAHPDPTVNAYRIVRGEPVKWASHDPRPCQIPPDW